MPQTNKLSEPPRPIGACTIGLLLIFLAAIELGALGSTIQPPPQQNNEAVWRFSLLIRALISKDNYSQLPRVKLPKSQYQKGDKQKF